MAQLNSSDNRLYEFGPFRVDPANRVLLREGERIPISPKAFDMLLVLVRNRGEVLEKDRLMDLLWPDSPVEEANLPLNISAIRKALGESPSERRFIITIPGRGYRFAADVTELTGEEPGLIIERYKRSTVLVREREEEEGSERGAREPSLQSAASRIRLTWRSVAVATVLLSIVLAGTAYVLRWWGDESASRVPVKSLAVLPFRDLTGGGTEYLGIGMTDTLITRLSRLRSITVRPTSAVLRYGDTNKQVAEIGTELGVESVLEGNIHISGDRIRVTVRLISVRDGMQMWADKFDEQFTGIFAVEDSISEQVVERLALQLSSEEKGALANHHTDSAEAHLLYLKGRYLLEKRTPVAVSKAIEFFELATEEDSNYSLAYAGIAESCFTLSITGNMRPREAFPRVKEAAKRALSIDPSLAEAYASLGNAELFHDWDWAGAERDFKRAIEVSPNYAFAYQMYANLLSNLGRHAEALAMMDRGLELDPLSLIANAIKGQMLQFAGKYDEAIGQLQGALNVEPSFWIAHLALGKVYERKKLYPQAIAELERAWELSNGSPEPKSYLGYTYAVSGDRAKARKMLDELKRMSTQRYVAPKHVALVYAGLGETDRMFEWLEEAYEDRDISLTFIKVEPRWDAYRAEPRFLSLLQRVGLSD